MYRINIAWLIGAVYAAVKVAMGADPYAAVVMCIVGIFCAYSLHELGRIMLRSMWQQENRTRQIPVEKRNRGSMMEDPDFMSKLKIRKVPSTRDPELFASTDLSLPRRY